MLDMTTDEDRQTSPAARGTEEYSSRMWSLASTGFTLASEVLAGTLIGWAIDHVNGTAPWGLVIGSLVGLIVGMTTFLRFAMRESRSAGLDAKRRAPFATVDPTMDDEDPRHDDDWNDDDGRQRDG